MDDEAVALYDDRNLRARGVTLKGGAISHHDLHRQGQGGREGKKLRDMGLDKVTGSSIIHENKDVMVADVAINELFSTQACQPKRSN